MTSWPTCPDVVVIGAGTAGLSAGRALMDASLSVIVLEAAGHIGGRCVTDGNGFCAPFDRGGSWLHSARINPLAGIAAASGLALHKAPWRWNRVVTDGRSLSARDVADYGRYHDRMWAAINEAGARRADSAIADVLPRSPWRGTARHWVAQMLGADAERASAQDVHRYRDADGDWLVAGGLGAFVAGLHRGVPVRLNCPATALEYSGKGVRVETPEGTLHARFALLTVSTAVLVSGAIRFSPALPLRKAEAARALPMGALNKVALEFAPDWARSQDGPRQGQMADYGEGGNAFCTILFGFYGSPLAVGFLAGDFADEAERAGPGAATAFCRRALVSIFGSNVLSSLRRTDETAWRGNPLTGGAYSYAQPHRADSRAALAEPLSDKVFFAGEATMPTAYATVHGAHQSGIVAAAEITHLARDGGT